MLRSLGTCTVYYCPFTAVDEHNDKNSIRDRPTGSTTRKIYIGVSVSECPLSACIRHEGG